ncbi:hypothetical protein N7G274_002089 [Stereocaulon virgatum]|uniref:Uncharacterized protein n=1 Tax=Stereocaulon virgatum TaxID=373712 RepID=A0ABR4AIQ0_9LECA
MAALLTGLMSSIAGPILGGLLPQPTAPPKPSTPPAIVQTLPTPTPAPASDPKPAPTSSLAATKVGPGLSIGHNSGSRPRPEPSYLKLRSKARKTLNPAILAKTRVANKAQTRKKARAKTAATLRARMTKVDEELKLASARASTKMLKPKAVLA